MATEDNPIATYIRNEYAVAGIQVESTGNKTVTCSFPPVFEDASEFMLDLADNFDATVDIETRDTGVFAIIWLSKKDIHPAVSTDTTSIFSTRVWLVPLFVCFVAYLMFTRGQAMMNDIKGVVISYAMLGD